MSIKQAEPHLHQSQTVCPFLKQVKLSLKSHYCYYWISGAIYTEGERNWRNLTGPIKRTEIWREKKKRFIAVITHFSILLFENQRLKIIHTWPWMLPFCAQESVSVTSQDIGVATVPHVTPANHFLLFSGKARTNKTKKRFIAIIHSLFHPAF